MTKSDRLGETLFSNFVCAMVARALISLKTSLLRLIHLIFSNSYSTLRDSTGEASTPELTKHAPSKKMSPGILKSPESSSPGVQSPTMGKFIDV